MTGVLTLAQVRRWDTRAITNMASGWTSTAALWEDTFTDLTNGILCTHWDGAAADHAYASTGTDRLEAIGNADRLRTAAAVARAGADRIAAARKAILDVVETATADGFTVADDFTISPRDQTRELSLRLDSRVERLLAVDRQVAAEINSAAVGLGNPLKEGPPDDPVFSTALPEDPQRFNELWNSLTQSDKDELFRRDESIGNHAGMPFAERDAYNRIRLDRLRAESQSRVDALQARVDDLAAQVYTGDHSSETTAEMHALAAQLAFARHRLDGYEEVRCVLAGGKAPRLLGLIDDRGHAAVSIGDPDTASRTAIFIPGTGQDMTTIGNNNRRSWDMFRAALDADPSLSASDVSVTTWVGYDRPMALTEAAWPTRARAGGAALDSFLDGMHASHSGPAAVDTVIGHSYGSTLVGAAATGGHHLAADNVIAVGSPGMLSRHAGDLLLDSAARVYSMAAENDPISLVSSLTLGADPNTVEYGATRLVTNPGSALPYSAGLLPGVSAHSSYWDRGNPGLVNMGAIIAGRSPVAVIR